MKSQKPVSTRRGALRLGAAGLAGAAALSPLASVIAAPAVPRDKGSGLPFDDPVWNREQAARLQSNLDGRQVYGKCSGTILGIRPGEKHRLLFGFEVFSTVRVLRRSDGNYDRMCKEVVFYTDPATGEILETWDNPYTGENVRVVDIANDPYNWVIRDWVGPPAIPGTDSHSMPRPDNARPFKLDWSEFDADTLLVKSGGSGHYRNLLEPATWPRESSGEMVSVTELFRFFIKRKDLQNAKLTHLPHIGIWLRITPWLPWMLMGPTEGHVLYEGEFSTHETLATFDPRVIDRVRRLYPQYMEAPTRWYGPSLSSLEHYATEQKPAPPRAAPEAQ